MKAIHLFGFFIIVVIAQLFVPAQMIFKRETTLNEGTAYKFRTEPIDPSDPFKGKYIRLNFDINSFATTDSTWTSDEVIYVSIVTDRLGYARVKQIDREAPADGDYVQAKVNWYNTYDNVLTFTLPFDEFYMNETKAYDAEIAHRDAQRDSIPSDTYALVYVKDGESVLDNVFIDDIPIANYVEKDN